MITERTFIPQTGRDAAIVKSDGREGLNVDDKVNVRIEDANGTQGESAYFEFRQAGAADGMPHPIPRARATERKRSSQ